MSKVALEKDSSVFIFFFLLFSFMIFEVYFTYQPEIFIFLESSLFDWIADLLVTDRNRSSSVLWEQT